MTRDITTIADLKAYLEGLFEGRPGDRYPRIQHAYRIDDVIMQVAGCLVMCADNNSIKVSQRAKDGLMRDINMLRFAANGRSFFMCYHWVTGGQKSHIQIRQDNRDGKVLARIDNDSSNQEIMTVFQLLARLDGSALDAKLMALGKVVARVSGDKSEAQTAEALAAFKTELEAAK